ncbi:hypothetical protein NE235_10785 [Actinoallomurus spadix]|uniref:Aminoglycoside phosphotransferase n=1 Tax=Actinoallomurus spadix TaxID=79912 RepID=A0ABN0WVS4_9ACTN|nr:hypothetical protein [Actinoallomurus spadix]MCO5986588.1 hypothetical protein [Actinoallomurus spadix]
MRIAWTELPGRLQAAIKDRTGLIHDIQPATRGNHAHIASTLHTAHGRVFVKAARKTSPDTDGAEVRALRWEAAVNPYVGEFAPRLLWRAEAGGWLALGFEHVDGRHADYSPGSPDLSALAKTIRSLQRTPCPPIVKSRVERRWQSTGVDVTSTAGDTLLHTDVNPDNLLLAPDGRVHLVDWAFVARGAAWVEVGLVIPWLLKAGHSPADAAAWIDQFPSWSRADAAGIDAFSEALARRWRDQCERDSTEWVLEHAVVTRQWAQYRQMTGVS